METNKQTPFLYSWDASLSFILSRRLCCCSCLENSRLFLLFILTLRRVSPFGSLNRWASVLSLCIQFFETFASQPMVFFLLRMRPMRYTEIYHLSSYIALIGLPEMLQTNKKKEKAARWIDGTSQHKSNIVGQLSDKLIPMIKLV